MDVLHIVILYVCPSYGGTLLITAFFLEGLRKVKASTGSHRYIILCLWVAIEDGANKAEWHLPLWWKDRRQMRLPCGRRSSLQGGPKKKRKRKKKEGHGRDVIDPEAWFAILISHSWWVKWRWIPLYRSTFRTCDIRTRHRKSDPSSRRIKIADINLPLSLLRRTARDVNEQSDHFPRRKAGPSHIPPSYGAVLNKGKPVIFDSVNDTGIFFLKKIEDRFRLSLPLRQQNQEELKYKM